MFIEEGSTSAQTRQSQSCMYTSSEDVNEEPPIPDVQADPFVLFVWVEALHPSQQFSVMSGQSKRFLGITSTFWEVNVSC